MISSNIEMHIVSAMHFPQPFTRRGRLHQSKQASEGPFQPLETRSSQQTSSCLLYLLVYQILIFCVSLIQTRAVIPEHCRIFCSLGLPQMKALFRRKRSTWELDGKLNTVIPFLPQEQQPALSWSSRPAKHTG